MSSAKASEVVREKVTLQVSDGSRMNCHSARPGDSESHAGIIVLQEAFGVNSHIRSVTERFAQAGYVAIAPELFHRTAPGFEGDYQDIASARPHMQAMTEAGAEADLGAALQWLQQQAQVRRDRIASAGFCMGGRISFLANASLPVRASVSYYGGSIAPGLLPRAPNLHAPMLFFWGEQDQHIPPEQRAAVIESLKTNGKNYVNVEFSEAGHGFFCDERAAYQPHAARQSWALMMEFLKTYL